METIHKTKEVADLLNVNPTTVQRWIKYFNIECETNEHGHYLLTESHLTLLTSIQAQLKKGNRLKEVELSSHQELIKTSESSKERVETGQYEQRLEHMLKRINEVENRLSQKADEVVSYQLLKHRSELEEMMKLLNRLEGRLTTMEEKINDEPEYDLPAAVGTESKKKWRSFMQLFSF